MDNRWKQLTEAHERLRWARIVWQEERGVKPDAGAAAESLGMNKHTYRSFERGPEGSKHTILDHQRAIQFGKKFGVSWQWLLTGTGTPQGELTPNERRVIDALREAPEARQTAVADAIEQLIKLAG